MTIYVVKQGDSVYSIAREFGVSPYQIIDNNALTPPYSLAIGQSLVISYEYNKTKPAIVLGYAYPNANLDVLSTALNYTTYLSPFTYGFKETGEIINLYDEKIINLAYREGKQCLMHLSTLTEDGRFDSNLASSILNNRYVWETMKDNILYLINAKGFSGLDIDFEFLPGKDALKYADFVSYLRSELSKDGLLVICALVPKSSENQSGDFYMGHNYKALGEASDYSFLMTYEWGYTYGPPQAISPISGVANVLNFALTQIPQNKILLGVSNYAYDWPLPYRQGITRARSFGNEEAVNLAIEKGATIYYDETAQAPYFNYTENNTKHIVWFEDARSIFERLKLVENNNLAGIGIWNLMRPFTQMYRLINSMFDII